MKYRNSNVIQDILITCLENLSEEEYDNFIAEQLNELDKDTFDSIVRRSDHTCTSSDNTSIDGLTSLINTWHDDRKIVPNSTAATQALKAMSEMGELADNIIKGKDVTDDIGDVYVCLCSVARLSDTTIDKCIEHAYNDIKDRTGTLLPNGNFVKDK